MGSIEKHNGYLSSSQLPPMTNSLTTQDEIFTSFFQDYHFIVYPPKQKVALTLTNREVDLVRKSWQLVSTDSAIGNGLLGIMEFSSASFSSSLFCHQLYDNLLDMKPDLIDMFPSIRHQAVAFAGIMNVTINNLESLEALDNVLEHLGRTHSRILGIEAPFFELMGDALIKTFQDRYNKSNLDFTIELEDCWIHLYCFLANSILQSGIDPLIHYERSPRSSAHYSKELQQSDSSLASISDQETLIAGKLSRRLSVSSSRTPSSSLSSVSSPADKSKIGSTKRAIRNFSLSSGNSVSANNTTTTSKIRFSAVGKDRKKKDGTCTVM